MLLMTLMYKSIPDYSHVSHRPQGLNYMFYCTHNKVQNRVLLVCDTHKYEAELWGL